MTSMTDILDTSARETLHRFKNAHGLTQKQIAEALDVPQPTVSKWMTGKRPVPLPALRILETLLKPAPALPQPGPPTSPMPPPPDPFPQQISLRILAARLKALEQRVLELEAER